MQRDLFLSVQGERALFLACHRLCFAWIDEWYGMTVEQIREMERQTDMLLKKVSVQFPLPPLQCLSPINLMFTPAELLNIVGS